MNFTKVLRTIAAVVLAGMSSFGAITSAAAVAAGQSQAITFVAPPPAQTFSLALIPLTATASSGLTVVFDSLTSAVCGVSGTRALMFPAFRARQVLAP